MSKCDSPKFRMKTKRGTRCVCAVLGGPLGFRTEFKADSECSKSGKAITWKEARRKYGSGVNETDDAEAKPRRKGVTKMAKKTKKRTAKTISIKPGTCKIVRGKVRICSGPNGLTFSYGKKGKKGRKVAAHKRAIPKICKTTPTTHRKGKKGKCTCISKKTGNVVKVKGACSKARKSSKKK
jgi:hypothetical protein